MDRRSALRHILIIGGAAISLPSCSWEKEKVAVKLKNFELSTSQHKLINEIAETIIPATDTPGAKELGIPQFILKMVDDCYKKEQQEIFISGLNKFDDYSRKLTGNSFVSGDSQARISILEKVKEDTNASEDLKDFVKSMRKLTILGYTTSKNVMTSGKHPYVLVPGYFHGCVKEASV